jgi:Tfp pilus assembly protein PilO
MNRRERLMLMIAIVLLGGIIFKFFIHDPAQAEYTTLAAARDSAAAELTKDQQIVARAEHARQEYERLRAYIATMEQKLPQRKEIPALLTAMEQFTKQVGVTLTSIHPGTLTAVNAAPAGTQGQAPAGQAPAAAARSGQMPARTLAYSSMPVDLLLNGTFAQTVDYLKQLRNFPRLIIVDSVSLAPQTLPKLNVTIRAEMYTLGTPSTQTGGTH